MSAAASKGKTCGLAVLTDLCGGSIKAIETGLPWHELRDTGLWLKEPPAEFARHEREVWSWHPRAHSGRPALPVPFTASELAAFMLAGGGLFLYERFVSNEGDSDQPADGALDAMGANASEAREALIEAFRLRSMATNAFGRTDEGVRQAAADLLGDRPKVKAGVQTLELILDAIRAAGFDPKNPPPYRNGTPAPHKQAAWSALKDRVSRSGFADAWQLGLSTGVIGRPTESPDPYLPGN